MATAEALMNAAEFGQRPDPGHPEELVRGRIIAMPPPDRRHGRVGLKVGRILDTFVEEHDPGRVMSNDSGVITEHDPDTVRGADIAYYSYARMPRGPLAPGYGPEVPELVIEVRSEGDTWPEIQIKVGEYLLAGVLKVVVLDPARRRAHVYSADQPPEILNPEEELTLPGLLEGFRVPVHRLGAAGCNFNRGLLPRRPACLLPPPPWPRPPAAV
jgi:Uma2 family endonuclease